MAYYNANKVIKLTRKAMGITQEKLSEGICEVETYSRMENGHRSVKRSTYQKLMEKMGRIGDKRYAVCVSKDGMLLDEKVELERAFKRYDYEAAEQHLKNLKEKADDNLLTRQYIAREEALVDYNLKRICAECLVERIDTALRMTAPEYEKYLDNDNMFPFVKLELLLLMSLGNAYLKLGNHKNSLRMYEVVLRCLQQNYLGEPDNMGLQLVVRNNIAMVYEEMGDNQAALTEIEECIQLASQGDYGHLMATLLAAKSFNIVKLVEKKIMTEADLDEAQKLSRQAYYIAAARQDKVGMNTLLKYYRDNFGEWGEI